jgi:hypothetical protein
MGPARSASIRRISLLWNIHQTVLSLYPISGEQVEELRILSTTPVRLLVAKGVTIDESLEELQAASTLGTLSNFIA